MAGNPTLVRPRAVVVGAGFGGLWAARALAGAPVDVLLLDRNNFHVFLPLLYQVAAAELEAVRPSDWVEREPRTIEEPRLYSSWTSLEFRARR